jgi:ribosomal protein S27E
LQHDTKGRDLTPTKADNTWKWQLNQPITGSSTKRRLVTGGLDDISDVASDALAMQQEQEQQQHKGQRAKRAKIVASVSSIATATATATANAAPSVTCQTCGKGFAEQQQLNGHKSQCFRTVQWQQQAIAKPFECEHGCGFDGDQATVEAHEHVCTMQPKPFECEHGCGFDGNMAAVEVHESKCSKRPPSSVSCQTCGKAFAQQQQLNGHKSQCGKWTHVAAKAPAKASAKHAAAAKATATTTSRGVAKAKNAGVKCKTCGKTFAEQKQLNGHKSQCHWTVKKQKEAGTVPAFLVRSVSFLVRGVLLGFTCRLLRLTPACVWTNSMPLGCSLLLTASHFTFCSNTGRPQANSMHCLLIMNSAATLQASSQLNALSSNHELCRYIAGLKPTQCIAF